MVTTYKTPEARSLIYNPQMFYAKSNQITQPGFLYKVICTDLITSQTQTYFVAQDPSGYCRFDAGPFAQSFFTHTLPINSYGWKLDAGIRNIRVNIGEYYVGAYYAGTNYDYIGWDGVEDVIDFPTFNINNYLYDNTVPNYKYLTSSLTGFAYPDRSDMLYVLTKGAGDLKFLYIKTYNAAGTPLGVYKIDNPFEASTTFSDKYLCIDIGYKGLNNISSGLVTIVSGTLPMITSSVDYYDVSETNSSAPDPVTRAIKRFNIGCSPRFPIYTLHFLRKNGGFETVHFNKRSDFTTTKEESTFQVYPYSAGASNTYGYSRSTQFEKTLSITSTDKFNLKTDNLSSAHIDLYKELFTSPLIYLDLGAGSEYLQIKYEASSYKLNKMWNEKLFNISADFRLPASNYTQR